MGLFDGLSRRDSAPQAMTPMAPKYNGNLGAPQNFWQGNQMQIPGLAAYLAQGQQPQGQGMAGMLQPQQQAAPQQKQPSGIQQFLQGGGLGLLPALLSGLFK